MQNTQYITNILDFRVDLSFNYQNVRDNKGIVGIQLFDAIDTKPDSLCDILMSSSKPKGIFGSIKEMFFPVDRREASKMEFYKITEQGAIDKLIVDKLVENEFLWMAVDYAHKKNVQIDNDVKKDMIKKVILSKSSSSNNVYVGYQNGTNFRGKIDDVVRSLMDHYNIDGDVNKIADEACLDILEKKSKRKLLDKLYYISYSFDIEPKTLKSMKNKAYDFIEKNKNKKNCKHFYDLYKNFGLDKRRVLGMLEKRFEEARMGYLKEYSASLHKDPRAHPYIKGHIDKLGNSPILRQYFDILRDR